MFYKRLHEAVLILHKFFSNGLTEHQLNTEKFVVCEHEFGLNKVVHFKRSIKNSRQPTTSHNPFR